MNEKNKKVKIELSMELEDVPEEMAHHLKGVLDSCDNICVDLNVVQDSLSTIEVSEIVEKTFDPFKILRLESIHKELVKSIIRVENAINILVGVESLLKKEEDLPPDANKTPSFMNDLGNRENGDK